MRVYELIGIGIKNHHRSRGRQMALALIVIVVVGIIALWEAWIIFIEIKDEVLIARTTWRAASKWTTITCNRRLLGTHTTLAAHFSDHERFKLLTFLEIQRDLRLTFRTKFQIRMLKLLLLQDLLLLLNVQRTRRRQIIDETILIACFSHQRKISRCMQLVGKWFALWMMHTKDPFMQLLRMNVFHILESLLGYQQLMRLLLFWSLAEIIRVELTELKHRKVHNAILRGMNLSIGK